MWREHSCRDPTQSWEQACCGRKNWVGCLFNINAGTATVISWLRPGRLLQCVRLSSSDSCNPECTNMRQIALVLCLTLFSLSLAHAELPRSTPEAQGVSS